MTNSAYSIETSGEVFRFSFAEKEPVRLNDLATRFEITAQSALRIAHRRVFDMDGSERHREELSGLIAAAELTMSLANAARREATLERGVGSALGRIVDNEPVGR